MAALQEIAEVRFNPESRELSTDELVAAAQGCELMIGYRQTPGPERLFVALPELAAFMRCAVDISTVDVAAASAHGVLVTQASPGFVSAVAEWVVASMIALGRGMVGHAEAYHQGRTPAPAMGRELCGSTIGVIGYGRIAQSVCRLAAAFGMRVAVAAPESIGARDGVHQMALDQLLAEAHFVVCLAVSDTATKNLMDGAAFARMAPRRLLRQRLARRARRRGSAPRRARVGPARRRRARRRPRPRPDAQPGAGTPSPRHRHAAHRRPDAAGDRAPVDGDGGAGRVASARRDAHRRGQRRARGADPQVAGVRPRAHPGDAQFEEEEMTAPWPDACDCHMHIYDDRYPLAPTATFKPPNAPVSSYREVQRELGLTRVVVIQPTGYGLDNRCTLAGMAALGANARGIAVVPADVAEAELQRLHGLGIRGVRFMMLPGGVLPWSALEPTAARIAPLGWHVGLQLDGRELPEREAMLAGLPGTIVVDHVGKFLEPVPVESHAFASLCRLLARGNFWIKLSAPYETSKKGAPGFEDVAALARALAARFPERCLWASNWPHPNARPEPSSRAMYEWARDCVGNDANWQRILVGNPAEVYGF